MGAGKEVIGVNQKGKNQNDIGDILIRGIVQRENRTKRSEENQTIDECCFQSQFPVALGF